MPSIRSKTRSRLSKLLTMAGQGVKKTYVKGAASKGSLSDMSLSKMYMTSHAKLCPTKDGKWSKLDLESGSYEDLAQFFTAETSIARKHPIMGLSVFAGTMMAELKELKSLRKMNILGTGFDSFINDLEGVQPSMQVLNTYGSSDIGRDEDGIAAAVSEARKNNS